MILRKWGIGCLLALYPAFFLLGMWHERQDCIAAYRHPCRNLWEDTALKSPLKPRPHAALGFIYSQQAQYASAMKQFGLAYDLSFQPGIDEHVAKMARLNSEVNIGHILQITGHDDEARRYLTQAWNQDPGFPGFAAGLSYYAIQDDSLAVALEILNNGIQGFRDYPQLEAQFGAGLYLNRGAIHEAQGDCVAANADYRVANRYGAAGRSCKPEFN